MEHAWLTVLSSASVFSGQDLHWVGLPQVKPLNWLQGSQFLFVLQGQSPCSHFLVLGLPCPAAKLCPSPQIMRFSSLGGGHRAVPQSSAGGMGSCSGICSREQWLDGSCLGRMAGHSGSSLWLQSPCGDQQGRLGGLCRALPPKHLMGCLFPSSKYQGSS